ncbi:hypothetical protein ACQ4M4_27355 [Leptolyngbya sp. AN02str]|uniref:hypothetical protein n=1 Tax=Leptolyngbya sp. AN02str TaxID=3423363 RepID=UPI003D3163EF
MAPQPQPMTPIAPIARSLHRMDAADIDICYQFVLELEKRRADAGKQKSQIGTKLESR